MGNNTKDFSIEEMNNLKNYVTLEAEKKYLYDEAREITQTNKQILDKLNTGDEQRDFLLERLSKYSLAELTKKLTKDSVVDSFFKNDETGESIELDVSFDTPDKVIEFKRSLLIMLKTSQEAMENIEKEQEKLDAATKEIDKDIKEACKELSDKTLSYISYMREKLESVEDEQLKARELETLRYIESGYTMEIYKESLIKHPSVKQKVLKELTREPYVQQIGRRYHDKLKRNKVKTSLVNYASDISANKKSFEELVLIHDEQYKTPDVFVYSVIRFFAMEDWSDPNIRKAHASLCLTLKRLVTNDFEDEVKKDIINAIVEYLKMFE